MIFLSTNCRVFFGGGGVGGCMPSLKYIPWFDVDNTRSKTLSIGLIYKREIRLCVSYSRHVPLKLTEVPGLAIPGDGGRISARTRHILKCFTRENVKASMREFDERLPSQNRLALFSIISGTARFESD